MPTETQPGTYNYELTASGPTLDGPITYTVTSTVNEVWHVVENGGFNAEWTRRGSSDVFDGVFDLQDEVGQAAGAHVTPDYFREVLLEERHVALCHFNHAGTIGMAAGYRRTEVCKTG